MRRDYHNHHSGFHAGIKVDINPIAEERITLAEYMKEADAYLDQQEIKKLIVASGCSCSGCLSKIESRSVSSKRERKERAVITSLSISDSSDTSSSQSRKNLYQ